MLVTQGGKENPDVWYLKKFTDGLLLREPLGVTEPVLRKHEVKREVDWEQSVNKCSCPGGGGPK